MVKRALQLDPCGAARFPSCRSDPLELSPLRGKRSLWSPSPPWDLRHLCTQSGKGGSFPAQPNRHNTGPRRELALNEASPSPCPPEVPDSIKELFPFKYSCHLHCSPEGSPTYHNHFLTNCPWLLQPEMSFLACLCVFLLIFFIHGISSETCICARGSCGNDWVQYMNACYKVEKKRKNWNDAEMACQRYGANAHLASIHSAEENDFIFHLMGKPLDRLQGKAYWIGAHDTFKEGTFVWTDGSRFDFQSFFPTEPNGLPGEHYLGSWYLQNGHITWNDYDITMKFPSVCKYSLANGMHRDSSGPKQV